MFDVGIIELDWQYEKLEQIVKCLRILRQSHPKSSNPCCINGKFLWDHYVLLSTPVSQINMPGLCYRSQGQAMKRFLPEFHG